MDDLLEAFQSFLIRETKPGQKFVLAVSGGVDSMALLDLAARSRSAKRKFLVAHLHHGIRGNDATGDASFVERAAKKAGIRFLGGKIDVPALARAEGQSIEMAARNARHQFLSQVAAKEKCRGIFLAHHADDQVELFFLRLLRGTSLDGLSGMEEVSPSPSDSKILLFRPLLGFTRGQLEGYLRKRRISFCHDHTNDDPNPMRNRIRHELLPLMENRFQPSLRPVVLRLMDLLRNESKWIHEMEAVMTGGKPFADWPKAWQRRRIKEQLEAMGEAPSFDRIENLRQKPDSPVCLKPGLRVKLTLEGILIVEKEPATLIHQPGSRVLKLSKTLKSAILGTLKVSGVIRPGSKGLGELKGSHPGMEWFDATKVGRSVKVRHWLPGDRFQPIGMTGTVKLQDLWVNARVPAPERRQRVVATTEDGVIFWVEGLRIGELFKLDKGTRERLKWSWKRLQAPGAGDGSTKSILK